MSSEKDQSRGYVVVRFDLTQIRMLALMFMLMHMSLVKIRLNSLVLITLISQCFIKLGTKSRQVIVCV